MISLVLYPPPSPLILRIAHSPLCPLPTLPPPFLLAREALPVAMRTRLWALALLISWVAVVSAVRVQQSLIRPAEEKACLSLTGTESQEFLTGKIRFRPGDVHNLFYFVDAPLGRFATRDFFAEMVLEDGNTSVPLFETYLHHWLMYEYAIPKTDRDKHKENLMAELQRDPEAAVLKGHKHRNERKALKDYPWAPDTWFLIQQFGVGAETRHTNTSMPIPYGFEGGDRFGEDYDSVWVLNVHAIDTRGAVERMACTECRCDVYNATHDATGQQLPDGYKGGLLCCRNTARCHVKDEFAGVCGEEYARYLRMKYVWTFAPWDECVEPLTNIRLDVTEIGFGEQLEYDIPPCKSNDPRDEECVDTHISYQKAPVGGDLISAVGHIHATSISATIWGEDGRLLCHSTPIYGTGAVVGNERGYVVGIAACWPPAGTASSKVTKGEMLKFQVKYSKVNGPHTGMMGLINLKIATGRDIVVS